MPQQKHELTRSLVETCVLQTYIFVLRNTNTHSKSRLSHLLCFWFVLISSVTDYSWAPGLFSLRHIQLAWGCKVSSAEGLGANIIQDIRQWPLRAWFIAKHYSRNNSVLQRAEWSGIKLTSSVKFAISEVATSNSTSFHFSAILQWSKCSSSQSKCCRRAGTAVIWEADLIIFTSVWRKCF